MVDKILITQMRNAIAPKYFEGLCHGRLVLLQSVGRYRLLVGRKCQGPLGVCTCDVGKLLLLIDRKSSYNNYSC